MNERNTYRPTVELTHEHISTIHCVTLPGDIETEIVRVHRRMLRGEYERADNCGAYRITDLALTMYEVTELIDALTVTGCATPAALLRRYRDRLPEGNDAAFIAANGGDRDE